MPISPLPQSAIVAIGSSHALTDSVSLVKELVDNALDAQASSVSVEIAPNTLDVIQVTDNGLGITPDDRDLVCRRHCTSNIRAFAEVATIGGKCLGFRGEALASAAELSGGLSVSTKVRDEVVGVSLKVDGQGAITSQEYAPRPIGTTVRVTDFLKHIPVRRQTALKTFGKCAGKIKTLLQAYALARPSVRFSLRILGAPGDKSNWTYALAPNPTVADAALQVVGKDVVKQCCRKAWSSVRGLLSLDLNLNRESEEYIILALVPVKHCDFSIISNTGQYLSVDSRPLSCGRGAQKKIVNLFKTTLQSCNPQDPKISSPFLCIDVLCPLGSYDPNIEPAKDDVLFIDEAGFLKMFNSFFHTIYGNNDISSSAINIKNELSQRKLGIQNVSTTRCSSMDLTTSTVPETRLSIPREVQPNRSDAREGPPKNLTTYAASELNEEDNGMLFELGNSSSLPSIHPDQSMRQSLVEHGTTHGQGIIPEIDIKLASNLYPDRLDDGHEQPRRSLPMSSMYNGTDYEELGAFDDESVFEAMDEVEDDIRDAKISNPWTLAKMNAAVRQKNLNGSTLKATNQLMTPERQRGEPSSPLVNEPPRDIQGPRARSWKGHQASTVINKPFKPQQPFIQPRGVDVKKRQTGSLDQWMHRPLKPSSTSVPARASRMTHVAVDPIPDMRPDNVKTPQERRESSRKRHKNQPDSSPKSPRTGWQAHRLHRQPDVQPREAWAINYNARDSGHRALDNDTSIPEAEHYIQAKSRETGLHGMNRRGNLTLNHQAQTAGQIPSFGQLNLPGGFDNNATRDQRISVPNPQIVTPPSSPREYLFDLQRTEVSDGRVSRRLKRRETAKLPLERVPVEYMVQNLHIEITISESTIEEGRMSLWHLDTYVKTGLQYFSLVKPLEGEIKMWEERAQAMLSNRIVAIN